MGRRYEDTLDYIEDSNYVRAKEECEKALELAEKLRDKEKLQEISGYMKLIEAVNMADDIYAEGKYEEAQKITGQQKSAPVTRIMQRIPI